jgi:tryptophan synthase alpha chain
MSLRNPIMVGFGIKDKATFQAAAEHASGAIIGTAFVKALGGGSDIDAVTRQFIQSVLA